MFSVLIIYDYFLMQTHKQTLIIKSTKKEELSMLLSNKNKVK